MLNKFKSLSLTQKKIYTTIFLIFIGTILFAGLYIKKRVDFAPQYVNGQKMIPAPKTTKEYKGEQFDQVKNQLQNVGYTNVSLEKIEDLILGWFTKDGAVEEVVINGANNVTSGQLIPENSTIVIRYHTFKETQNSSTQNTQTQETSQTTTTQTTTVQTTTQIETTTKKVDDIMSADNNEQFKTISELTDPHDPSVEAFAKANIGKTISFTGEIALVANHQNYKTRFDVAIMSTDSQGKGKGPMYTLNNLSFLEMRVKGTDTVKPGMTFEIVAKIDGYDTQSKSIKLIPISMTVK